MTAHHNCQDTLNPYTKAMTSYIRIGPPAWAAVTDERGRLKQRIKDEDFDYVDYQVQRWHDSLPAHLRFNTDSTESQGIGDCNTSIDRGTQVLRYILYLRANQFRIVVMRPLLFSSQTYAMNIKRVRIVAQTANDTVERITEMNDKYDLYKRLQPILNLFLSSALSTLFLVYIHSLREERSPINDDTRNLPSFTQMVRDGLNKGLELIQSYSTFRSSKLLWQKFAGPQGLLPRLGLAGKAENADMASSGVHNSMSTGVSSNAGTAFDNSEEGHLNARPYGLETVAGPYNHTYAYPSASGFAQVDAANIFEVHGISTEYSPLPFLNMNPLLVSNDIDVFYDDMWGNNIF